MLLDDPGECGFAGRKLLDMLADAACRSDHQATLAA
jgi:hypothetical protein